MIIFIFQFVYMLFLLPVCFFVCHQIQKISRKALEHLAIRKGYSKNITIWKPRGSKKLIATPSNEIENFLCLPMVVITLFQPVLFLIFANVGIYVLKIIFQ